MDRPIGIINRPLWRSAPALETASSVRWQTWIGLLVALFLLALVGWLHLEQKAEQIHRYLAWLEHLLGV